MLVCTVDSVPVGRAHGIRDDPGIGRAVYFVRERRISSDGLFDLLGELLGPDCAGDAAAKCGPDIVRREVETWKKTDFRVSCGKSMVERSFVPVTTAKCSWRVCACTAAWVG